jgi:hypothetical protein
LRQVRERDANGYTLAGSIAAGVQGANVVAGGIFATLQSAAMGGYGLAAVAGAAQAVGGVTAVAGGAGAAAALAKKNEGEVENIGDGNSSSEPSGTDE